MLALALLAAPIALAPAADAVVGDPAADGERPYVVKLDIGTEDRACSGALVEARWVLTAASCFVEDPAQYGALAPGAPHVVTRATVGRTDLTTTAGAVRDVVELVPLRGRDLALARLDRSVTNVEPISLSVHAALVGDTVEVAGYGRTANEWAPLRMHRESFMVNGRTATDLRIDSESGGAICMGDAGAPIIRAGIDGDELVAVTSRSGQGGCFGSAEGSTAAAGTRVDDLANVIGARVARWAMKSRTSGRYVTAETSRAGNLAGVLRAGSTVVSTKQVFTLHTVDDSETVAFRSEANGLFVTSEIGRTDSYRKTLRARAGEPRAWERFTLHRMSGGYYAIKSEAASEYVQVPAPPCCDVNEDTWLLRANGGDWEPPVQGPVSAGFQFTFEHLDNFKVDGYEPFPQPMPYPHGPPTGAAPTDDLLPFVVEDFNYPGADRILAERGFHLFRGDGHITLADCSVNNVIVVMARNLDNRNVCFRVTGSSGWLTLELPSTFNVRTNNYANTHIELVSGGGDRQSLDLQPNRWNGVGESLDPGREFALVEIRVSR